jgi:pimeloyl-ACP methyl ester carboxylesterase
MFDEGNGPPVVIVQGVHGRWQWTRPALEELAKTCRVISYSLAGDFGSGRHYDPAAGFESYTRQLHDVLRERRIERATICGISFGGFVAVHYAAAHSERVEALVLASAPGPGWSPNPRQAGWIARPWLSAPIFAGSAPFRLWPEVRRATGGSLPALRFMARQGVRAAWSPAIPSLMAARIRDAQRVDFDSDCARIQAPTLVLSGEEHLDRVVPVATTRRYAQLIGTARYEQLTGTGHLGVLTQPKRFAQLVSDFVHANHH